MKTIFKPPSWFYQEGMKHCPPLFPILIIRFLFVKKYFWDKYLFYLVPKRYNANLLFPKYKERNFLKTYLKIKSKVEESVKTRETVHTPGIWICWHANFSLLDESYPGSEWPTPNGEHKNPSSTEKNITERVKKESASESITQYWTI